jgi:hypothetical protein
MAPNASSHARSIAEVLGSERGLRIVQVPLVGNTPVIEPEPGDVFVHGFPDVFGRVIAPPGGWDHVLVCEPLARPFVDTPRPMIEAGPPPVADPRVIAGALRALYKKIIQQRRVRPVFAEPPLLGLALVAPVGVELTGEFGELDHPFVVGLPDLVVVRPVGIPPLDSQRLDPAPVVVA